jgi:hypothetical protein
MHCSYLLLSVAASARGRAPWLVQRPDQVRVPPSGMEGAAGALRARRHLSRRRPGDFLHCRKHTLEFVVAATFLSLG